jgi:hypothetical protein
MKRKNPIESQAPLFLRIPVPRLILLSILSFSLYEMYWIYKNWRYVKERDSAGIRPFWRGVFGVFYCHGLLRRIHQDREARSVQRPAFSPGNLATGWVILVVISNRVSRAPGVAVGVVSALIPSFLCLVPVQKYINAVEEKRNGEGRFYGWSSGHILCVVLGALMWSGLLLGSGGD